MKREFGLEAKKNLKSYLESSVFYEFKRGILSSIEGMKARAAKNIKYSGILSAFYRDIEKVRTNLSIENEEFKRFGLIPSIEHQYKRKLTEQEQLVVFKYINGASTIDCSSEDAPIGITAILNLFNIIIE